MWGFTAESLTKHILAIAIAAVFFVVILVTLLGFVDLKDATVVGFVGVLIGYVANPFNRVVDHYFKKVDEVNHTITRVGNNNDSQSVTTEDKNGPVDLTNPPTKED